MKTSVPSHTQRKDQLHVLTMDPVLAEDVCERLADDPRLEGVERIAPEGQTITVQDIEALAKDTIQSRVLILDVRSLTLPRLMMAYNRVSGYNRGDFNVRCFTVLIGDGPPALFSTEHTFDVMASTLARMRMDFHAVRFFFDPFTHYPHEERPGLQIDGRDGLPEGIPERLTRWFKEDNVSVADVRRYFRAAGAPPEKRQAAKAKRAKKLRQVLETRIMVIAPGEEEKILPILTHDGLKVRGETLPVNVYPFCFEDWVAELMQR